MKTYKALSASEQIALQEENERLKAKDEENIKLKERIAELEAKLNKAITSINAKCNNPIQEPSNVQDL